MSNELESTTCDELFYGGLKLNQYSEGYRYGIEAVLLGASSLPTDREIHVLDAGCGSGVIGLTACYFHKNVRVQAVDIQPEMAQLANLNARTNNLKDRYRAFHKDLRNSSLLSELDAPFDFILMNPPYFTLSQGKINKNNQKSAARHEVNGTLLDLIKGVRRLLSSKGTLRLVFPAPELMRLLRSLDEVHLKVARIKPIHSFHDHPAKLVIVDARNYGQRHLQLEPPLILFTHPNEYTTDIKKILTGDHVPFYLRRTKIFFCSYLLSLFSLRLRLCS